MVDDFCLETYLYFDVILETLVMKIIFSGLINLVRMKVKPDVSVMKTGNN